MSWQVELVFVVLVVTHKPTLRMRMNMPCMASTKPATNWNSRVELYRATLCKL
jgi:hypothetical protein